LGRTGKRPTLGRDIGAGDRDELFGGADPDIGRRNVAEERDENLVVVRDRGEIGGVGRFDPAAKFAPKIQFPGRLDGKRISPETVGAGFGGGERGGSAGPIVDQAAGALLGLRVEFADRDAEHGAGLERRIPQSQLPTGWSSG